MKRRVILGAAAIVLAAGAVGGSMLSAAHFGPPMICQPIDVGAAPTIAERGVPVPEVVAALDKAETTLVRMEILRLASVAAHSGGKAGGLLHALMARAMDASAGGKKERVATTYFDAAYFIGCLRQYGDEVGKGMGVAEGVDGYAWMKHALAQGTDTSMHFGAALLVHPAMHRAMGKAYRQHMAAARGGAASGSLLAKNLDTHGAQWDRYLPKEGEGKQ